MPTTVIPSFTGSVSTSIQGTNINSYERFGRMSGLPLLGRSNPDIYYLSSSSGVRTLTPDNRYFDETFRFASPIGKGYGSGSIKEAQSNIGEDDFKIIPAPSFFMEKNLYGISKDFEDNTPFQELQKWDSVQYIIKQDTYQWPVVLDSPGALDPFDYNGVIEPLEIRRVVAGASTFLDSIEDPEPHSVKGDVWSPEWQIGSFRRVFKINEFYSKFDKPSEPWEPVSDRIFDSKEPTLSSQHLAFELGKPALTTFRVISYSSFNSGKIITIHGLGLTGSTAEAAGGTRDTFPIGSSNAEMAQNIVAAINSTTGSFYQYGICSASLGSSAAYGAVHVNLRVTLPAPTGSFGWMLSPRAGECVDPWGNGMLVVNNDSSGWSYPDFDGDTANQALLFATRSEVLGVSWVKNPLSQFTYAQSGSGEGNYWRDFSIERFIKPLTYVTDHTASIRPWRDRPGQEELFGDIRDQGIRSYLEGNSGAMTLGGRPNKDSESAATGFTFDNTEFGIDSIAFGGMKK